MQIMQLPEDFIRETRLVMGEQRFNRFMEALNEEPPTSIRINPKLISNEKLVISNCDYSDNGDSRAQRNHNYSLFITNYSLKVPWCSEGYYLPDRPQFTFDPLFHAGCYYVQEAASMFITHILRHVTEGRFFCDISGDVTKEPSLCYILDLCAAPGGKSTAMRTVLPEGSTLVSNEPIPTRAQILLENITKWGWPDCIVTNNYPRDFRKAKARFDLILCDVPCSGEGMFRKDPNSISEWSLQNVEKCWRLQREIVADAWECLNPGGLLIYSTCTYNIKENEENVRWIIDTYDAEPLNIPTDPSWNITGSLLPCFDAPVYRFIPGLTRSEGLFMCALKKRGMWSEECGVRNVMPQKRILQDQALKVISLHNPHSCVPPVASDQRSSASFLPPRERADLSYSDALRYLRGEALVLPPDVPRGIVTVTYKGVPLGPVKNIGNRANNLYPKPWRIKSTHLPSEPPQIMEQIVQS